jgi:hypothetical protein
LDGGCAIGQFDPCRNQPNILSSFLNNRLLGAQKRNNIFLEDYVNSIFYRVFGSAIHLGCYFLPLVALFQIQPNQFKILFNAPVPLLDLRIKMIRVTFLALLSRPKHWVLLDSQIQFLRHLCPIGLLLVNHQIAKYLVLLQGPRVLIERVLEKAEPFEQTQVGSFARDHR